MAAISSPLIQEIENPRWFVAGKPKELEETLKEEIRAKPTSYLYNFMVSPWIPGKQYVLEYVTMVPHGENEVVGRKYDTLRIIDGKIHTLGRQTFDTFDQLCRSYMLGKPYKQNQKINSLFK